MIEDRTTWIVTADGRNARVFEERRRHGPLHELEAMAIRLGSQDQPRAAHPGGTVHQSGGFSRHNIYASPPAEEAEERFLKRLAGELDRAAKDSRCEALVLIAPPRALGALRSALAHETRRLVLHEDPHDRVSDNAAELRERLRALRTPD
jgi:protein required for attachment to host cells